MSAFIDVAGIKFGRLTPVKVVDKKTVKSGTVLIWECICDCGNTKNVSRTVLGRSTNSCGCLRKESTKKQGRKNTGSLRGLEKGISARNKLFDHYRRAAIGRGLSFEITLDQFVDITKKNCWYCNTEPKQIARNKGNYGEYIYNGVDRLDNTVGYILENCVPCCKICNNAKHAMPLYEFYNWVERIFSNIRKDEILVR